MKFQITLFVIVLNLFSQTVKAQTFDWAVRAGSDGLDGVTDMVQDDYGNIYILGNVESNAQFGNILTANGGVAFAKLDSTGIFKFVKIIPDFYGSRIEINNQNQILVSGQFLGSSFDGTPVINPSGSSFTGIAALYDTSGVQVWLTVMDLAGRSVVDIDSNNNFILCGSLPINGQVGTFTFTNSSQSTFYTLIDSLGSIIYADVISTNSYVFDVVSSKSGCFYIRGEYYSSTQLSNGQILSNPKNGSANYLIRVNALGNIDWVINEYDTSPSSGGGFQPPTMDLLGNGNILITTTFTDTLFLDTDSISTTFPGINNCIVSIDSMGTISWIQVLDADAFITLYALDQTGFYAGINPMLPGALNIGGFTLSPMAGYFGIYLVRFDLNGTPVWGKVINSHHLGGFCCQSIRGVTLFSNDELYISGFYYDETLFDGIALNCYLKPNNLCSPYELFVSKLVNISLSDIENIFKLEETILYPNPSDGIINVKLPITINGDVNYKVIDITGRVIKEGIISNSSSTIDLLIPKSGFYTVMLSYENYNVSKKVLIAYR
jgi:type IX secretion system substrate protein